MPKTKARRRKPQMTLVGVDGAGPADKRPIQTPALRIIQQGTAMFVTALPLKFLADVVRTDYWQEENPEGYQRPLIGTRLKDVATFLRDERGIFPTGIVLAARGGRSGITFAPQTDLDGFGESGTLTIPRTGTLWLVDGQHRVNGAMRAWKEGATDLADFPFTVTILQGVSRYEEMLQFHIINTRDKRVPSDIADRHLIQRYEKEGAAAIAMERNGPKRVMQAEGAIIADRLNREAGVWKGQIKIPSVKGREKGLAKQHAFVFSLEPVFRDAWTGDRINNDERSLLVKNYWAALRNIWPDAFKNPKDHRIQASAGLFALHMILPNVVQAALDQRGRGNARLTVDELTDVLEPLKKLGNRYRREHRADFWAKEGGHPLTVAIGLGAHRQLAAMLRVELPKVEAEAEAGRERMTA